eukprot:Gb_05956 [translate_table: standard]
MIKSSPCNRLFSTATHNKYLKIRGGKKKTKTLREAQNNTEAKWTTGQNRPDGRGGKPSQKLKRFSLINNDPPASAPARQRHISLDLALICYNCTNKIDILSSQKHMEYKNVR